MVILGINDTHDASACLIKDGKLLVAVQEERYRRVKQISSFPKESIKNILKFTGITPKEIDHVAVATKILNGSLMYNTVADFKIDDWKKLHEIYFYNLI